MFLQSRALKIEEKARITVNGAILPPLMHVRDDTACSNMTTLFSVQSACPSLSQGEEGAGLTLESNAIIDVSLSAHCMLPGPLCCTWLKPSCSSRISNVLICFAMALLMLLLRHVTNLNLSSLFPNKVKGWPFPHFAGWEARKEKGSWRIHSYGDSATGHAKGFSFSSTLQWYLLYCRSPEHLLHLWLPRISGQTPGSQVRHPEYEEHWISDHPWRVWFKSIAWNRSGRSTESTDSLAHIWTAFNIFASFHKPLPHSPFIFPLLPEKG